MLDRRAAPESSPVWPTPPRADNRSRSIKGEQRAKFHSLGLR
jgi:hypothetical protein